MTSSPLPPRAKIVSGPNEPTISSAFLVPTHLPLRHWMSLARTTPPARSPATTTTTRASVAVRVMSLLLGVGRGMRCRAPAGLVRVEDLAVGPQVGRVEEDRVGAWTTVDVVLGIVHVALPHVDDVVAAAAGDDVDVGDTWVGVGDGVITTAAIDGVVASAPLDRVIAAPAVDRVGTNGAGDRIGLLAAVAGNAGRAADALGQDHPAHQEQRHRHDGEGHE